MALRRPLTFQSTSGSQGMRDLSDSEMGLLRYNLACAYSDLINTGISIVGAVSTGTGKADIYDPMGSGAEDTKRNQVTASNTAGGPDSGTGVAGMGALSSAEDWPAYPTVTTTVVSTTRWQQNFDSVTYPTNQTINDNSYLYYAGDGTDFNFRYTSLEADFMNTIIDDTILEMRTGHGIGTYYVAAGTSAPFYLGNGDWTNKGTIFTDTTYSAGSTSYTLWLKRNLTDPSGYTGSALPFYRWETGGTEQGFNEISVAKSGGLIQNVLLPIMQRNVTGSGKLQYRVGTSSSGLARGTFLDKRQEGFTESRVYNDPLYQSIRTPSGPTSTITTYYFQMV